MTEDTTTLVRLRRRTIKELKRYGKFGESYDDLIWKIIKSYKISLKLGRKK